MDWEYETEDGEAVYGRPPGCTDLDQFSAACFYFAMALTDRMVAEGASEVRTSAASALGCLPPTLLPTNLRPTQGGCHPLTWLIHRSPHPLRDSH